MATPHTCTLGYNSLRFDDEFTRFTLYRNLLDPYAREWQHGNTRWDLIDLARAAWALRPDGIAWPQHADGRASFRLEDLTRANGIEHGSAHDALADVRATIAFAKRLRAAQPRLYDYAWRLRQKSEVLKLLDPGAPQPLVHVSSRFGAARHFTAVIAVLAVHPVNRNEFIAVDLMADPAPLLSQPAEALAAALFAPAGSAGERPPLKTVRANRAPFLAPLSVLDATACARLEIDLPRCREHLAQLLAERDLPTRLSAAYAGRAQLVAADPEQALYSGGFFSDGDRRAMASVHEFTPEALAQALPVFADARLPELLFRLRARNWPRTLTEAEQAEWEEYRRARLTDVSAGASIGIADYRARIAALRGEPGRSERDLAVLDALSDWGVQLLAESDR
jgi:exodeoxyribonuclease-1